MNPCLLRDSKDCITADYGRIIMHMLDCTNLIVLNERFSFDKGTHMLPASGGGSVVDYVFMKACDLSMVNAF